MSLFVDHVGLNTLVSEEITSSINTRGASVVRSSVSVTRDAAIGVGDSSLNNPFLTTSGLTGYPTSGALAFSFWVNLDDLADDTVTRYVMYATNASSYANIIYFDDGRIKFAAKSASSFKRWEFAITIGDFVGSWKHVYVTWDGNFSNNPVVYVNAVSLGSPSTTGGSATGTTYLAPDGFRFFDHNTSSPSFELAGRLQSFSIYKSTLPAVGDLYSSGVPPNSNMPSPSTNLVDFWLLGNEPQFFRTSLEGSIENSVILSTSGTIGTNLTASTVDVKLREGVTTDVPPTISTSRPGFVGGVSEGASLAALNTHRNGPYGYSSWQQLRTSENPITRHQIANSTMTFVTEPGPIVALSGGLRIRSRYSTIHSYTEPAIAQKGYPLVWNVGRHFKDEDGQLVDKPQKFSMMSSYANQQIGFANEKVDKLLKYGPDEEQTEYVTISNMYLENGLNKQDSPLTYWEFLQYRETVYPHMKNQFQNENLERPQFESFYRHKRSDRTRQYLGGFGSSDRPPFNPGGTSMLLVSSRWVLDEDLNFLTRTYPNPTASVDWDTLPFGSVNAATALEKAGPGARERSYLTRAGEGVLVNTQTQFMDKGLAGGGFLSTDLDSSDPNLVANAIAVYDGRMSAGPLYMRRTSLQNTASVANPSGMNVPETGSSHFRVNELFQGGALWEAGTTREVKDENGDYVSAVRYPFYDSYEHYIEEARRKNKNFSVVPEFRISTQIEDYIENNLAIELDMFDVTGGTLNAADSSQENFYEIYSNSDFMRNFEIVNDDHKDFTNGKVLSLRCKAIKKFLPYESFYPAQRTVDLAKRFYDSFKDNISLFNSNGVQLNDFNFGRQMVMSPLFAPGILYNTIKSGVAVDYPVLTEGNAESMFQVFSGDKKEFMIIKEFDKRIPFEAIVEPNNYLDVDQFYSQEPHPSGNLSASATWDGQGDELYTKMANNFMAEVPSFFLPNGQLTSIVSKKQEDITLTAGAVYGMRVKMRRTMDSGRGKVYHYATSSLPYYPPQDVNSGSANVRENFTMYSRPSAFGPPTYGVNVFDGATAFADQDDGKVFTFDPRNEEDDQNSGSRSLYKNSMAGFNFPYTPPYYHGEGWCEIVLTASSNSMTIKDIQESASYTYTRFDDSFYTLVSGAADDPDSAAQVRNLTLPFGPQAFPNINRNAVQLSASLNLKGIGTIRKKDGQAAQGSLIVDTAVGSESRWVIQTKFETPMLNFNHISNANGNLSLPVYGSESVPRGMWHQYGRIPEENQGVFIEVGPIEQNYWNVARGEIAPLEDLSAALGFAGSSTKIGRLASSKKISECVVAVPFIEKEGGKKFFRLPLSEDQLEKYNAGEIEALTTGPAQSQIGRSVLLQLDKMKRFVFPPSFDFLNFPDVDPVSMYVFEFTHTLSQQDLSDIWQNLPPDIGETMETAEVAITHPLLQKELLGEGGEEGNQLIDMPERLRWMVFKVKQRAASNYFKKTVLRNPQVNVDVDDGDVVKDEFGDTSAIQYNWPYDYFSLVELVKIDAEVELGNFNEEQINNYTDNLPNWEGVSADPEKIEYIVGGLEDDPIPEVEIPEPSIQDGITASTQVFAGTDIEGQRMALGNNVVTGTTMGLATGVNTSATTAGAEPPKTLEEQSIENITNKVTPTRAELRLQWLKRYGFEYSATSVVQSTRARVRKANKRTNKKIRETYSYVNGIDSLVGLYGAPPGQGSLQLGGIPPGVN